MYLPRTWPVGIPLLTDESFSSWVARIAWAHGATPSALYRIALPGGRIGGIDLDHHACDDLILNLSWHAGIPADALEAATLRRRRGTVYDTDDDKPPIMVTAGQQGLCLQLVRTAGLLPCLAEDQEPLSSA